VSNKKHLNKKQKHNEIALTDQVVEIRQDYLFSEALIYFLCSGFIMLGTTISASSLNIFGTRIPWVDFPYWFDVSLSFVLLVVALVLFALSFVRKSPHVADFFRKAISYSRIVPYSVFAIEMLRLIKDMMDKNITPLFVIPYFYLGLILAILIVVQQIYIWTRNRRSKNK
jgi:hypothetical protein